MFYILLQACKRCFYIRFVAVDFCIALPHSQSVFAIRLQWIEPKWGTYFWLTAIKKKYRLSFFSIVLIIRIFAMYWSNKNYNLLQGLIQKVLQRNKLLVLPDASLRLSFSEHFMSFHKEGFFLPVFFPESWETNVFSDNSPTEKLSVLMAMGDKVCTLT